MPPPTPDQPPDVSAAHIVWARYYTQVLHWAIFPCRGKAPLTANGLHAATRDPTQIERWWGQWPSANPGIPAAPYNPIVIVDTDPRHGGDEAWKKLCAEHGLPGHANTARVRSGGADNGIHFYFSYAGPPLRTRSISPGIDFRSVGNYVIAPPSIHPDTQKRYQWLTAPASIKPLPSWIADLAGRYAPRAPGAHASNMNGDIPPISEGGRRVRLTQLAGKLVLLQSSPEAIFEYLKVTNQTRCTPPLPEHELDEIVTSAEKWHMPPTTGERMTDMGNSQRFMAQYGHQTRWDTSKEQWRLWDDKCWALAERGEVKFYGQQTVLGIHEEAALEQDVQRQEKLAKWAVRSETPARINAMLELVRDYPDMSVTARDLDADPLLINCLNGALDLRDGELRRHRQEHLMTRMIPWEYHAEAEPPSEWLAFLQHVLPGQELQDWAHIAAGYCLSGLTTEQVFWLLWGTGNNGKSTYLDVLRGVLGEEYAQQAPKSLLLEHKPGAISNDLADLPGYRLVTYSEFPNGGHLDLEVLKGITGESTLRARHLYAENFEFPPQCKLFITANTRPNIAESTEAVWRRMRMVPFTVKIAESERKKGYAQELLTREGAQIFTWMVQGWERYRALGRVPTPTQVQEATQQYRRDSDVLQQFLTELCVLDDTAAMLFNDLLAEFHGWLTTNSMPTRRYGRPWLKEELLHHNLRITSERGGLIVSGVKMNPEKTLEIEL